MSTSRLQVNSGSQCATSCLQQWKRQRTQPSATSLICTGGTPGCTRCCVKARWCRASADLGGCLGWGAGCAHPWGDIGLHWLRSQWGRQLRFERRPLDSAFCFITSTCRMGRSGLWACRESIPCRTYCSRATVSPCTAISTNITTTSSVTSL